VNDYQAIYQFIFSSSLSSFVKIFVLIFLFNAYFNKIPTLIFAFIIMAKTMSAKQFALLRGEPGWFRRAGNKRKNRTGNCPIQ
jgi:hypothetical protein